MLEAVGESRTWLSITVEGRTLKAAGPAAARMVAARIQLALEILPVVGLAVSDGRGGKESVCGRPPR